MPVRLTNLELDLLRKLVNGEAVSLSSQLRLRLEMAGVLRDGAAGIVVTTAGRRLAEQKPVEVAADSPAPGRTRPGPEGRARWPRPATAFSAPIGFLTAIDGAATRRRRARRPRAIRPAGAASRGRGDGAALMQDRCGAGKEQHGPAGRADIGARCLAEDRPRRPAEGGAGHTQHAQPRRQGRDHGDAPDEAQIDPVQPEVIDQELGRRRDDLPAGRVEGRAQVEIGDFPSR